MIDLYILGGILLLLAAGMFVALTGVQHLHNTLVEDKNVSGFAYRQYEYNCNKLAAVIVILIYLALFGFLVTVFFITLEHSTWLQNLVY